MATALIAARSRPGEPLQSLGCRHLASPVTSDGSPPERPQPAADGNAMQSVRSPMEAHGSYRGKNWSPQRLVFHQNLESFAEQVGLIVGLQSNGKLSQEQAYAQIRQLWKGLKQSKDALIDGQG